MAGSAVLVGDGADAGLTEEEGKLCVFKQGQHWNLAGGLCEDKPMRLQHASVVEASARRWARWDTRRSIFQEASRLDCAPHYAESAHSTTIEETCSTKGVALPRLWPSTSCMRGGESMCGVEQL
jgi:hypothetical protein